MGGMDVKYTVNDDATVITITITATDDKPLTVIDLTNAFEAVLDELDTTGEELH